MIPGKKQWEKWSLPSKHTTLGLIVGIIGVLLTLFLYFLQPPSTSTLDSKAEVESVYLDCLNEVERIRNYPDSSFSTMMIPPLDMSIKSSDIKEVIGMHGFKDLKKYYSEKLQPDLMLLNSAIMDEEGLKNTDGQLLVSVHDAAIETLIEMYPESNIDFAATKGVKDLKEIVQIRKKLFFESYEQYCNCLNP